MKNDKFFKHDATASDDEKVLVLIEQEGMKGYGTYWVLLEALRKQEDLCLSFGVLRPLAARCRTKKEYLLHIVRDFGLFVVEDTHFHSPGMMRRMARYQALAGCRSVNQSVNAGDNALKNRRVSATHVRDKDKIGQDLNLTVVEVDRIEGQQPVQPYPGWEALVDEMAASEEFMCQAGMHSGLGNLFLLNKERIIGMFKTQICLQGKQDRMMNLGEVKSYFSNFVSNGSFTNKKLRAALQEEMKRQSEKSAYRFEELIDGKRMYLGHLIPDDVPPRPDASAVWDGVGNRWVH